MVVDSLPISISRSRSTNATPEAPRTSLFRRLLHHLIAARTGHGDFAAYHRQFNHYNANVECTCGLETSPTYFIRCRNNARILRKLRDRTPLNESINQLLGYNGMKKFKEFAQATGCFDDPPAE